MSANPLRPDVPRRRGAARTASGGLTIKILIGQATRVLEGRVCIAAFIPAR